MKRTYPRGSAILTSGSINMKTGMTKFFNIFENASLYPMCMFFLKTPMNPNYMLVMGAGNSESYSRFQIGSMPEMFHDQSWRTFHQEYEVIDMGPVNAETLARFKDKIKPIVRGGKSRNPNVNFGVFK